MCSDVGEALLTSFSACTYILFHKAAKATNTKRWWAEPASVWLSALSGHFSDVSLWKLDERKVICPSRGCQRFLSVRHILQEHHGGFIQEKTNKKLFKLRGRVDLVKHSSHLPCSPSCSCEHVLTHWVLLCWSDIAGVGRGDSCTCVALGAPVISASLAPLLLHPTPCSRSPSLLFLHCFQNNTTPFYNMCWPNIFPPVLPVSGSHCALALVLTSPLSAIKMEKTTRYCAGKEAECCVRATQDFLE